MGDPATTAAGEALAGRVFEATLGAFDLMAIYLGDRLGLYRALADGQPSTAAGLAGRSGIDVRYAREWLEQQAASGILEVDDAAVPPDERRFRLPAGHVEPLTNLDSALSVTPLVRSVVAVGGAMPGLLAAYRTGGGVDWAAYGADMIEAQGDFNRPWLLGSFGAEILPAIPAVHARLRATPPARVADVACGVGWASIALARSYPAIRIDGFDLDPQSIELARANAEQAGVADRVTFAVRDAADPAAVGQYDVVVVIEAIHDLSRPVEVLAAIWRMLRPGGLALIADEKTTPAFAGRADDLERLYYGFSALVCLPAAMTERPTAATGTVMRPDTFRSYAAAAGFRHVEILDEPSTETLRFHVLAP